ncbi:hypothetical protein B9Q22_09475 [Enterobacter roggenkampii]|nr:hypothetical protein B9Q21_17990 [Enterobacter roggenkampii]PJD22258.1 hypothetical protein B9Q22_09475 [Enterobacter roggenkampii]
MIKNSQILAQIGRMKKRQNWGERDQARRGAGSRRMMRMLGITVLLLPHQKIALMRPLQHLTEMD